MIVYGIGSAVCHQLPARSFHLFGTQMPVCARCAGIYIGAAVTALGLFIVSAARRGRSTQPMTYGVRALTTDAASVRIVLLIAALPAFATLVSEWTTGVAPSNTIRALSGFPLGAAATAIALSALDNQVN
jgi:uncharacterized membrane protein